MWNPNLYRHYASERARPFIDLTARIGAQSPGHVVDLGCGPGEMTAALAARWPGADVLGVDSSAEMVAAAGRTLAGQAPGLRLRFAAGDVRTWQPERAPDVIVCNAVLQWVPGHQDLLTRWAGWLAPGGWLALQVPANDDQPSYRLLRELIAAPRWRPLLADVDLAGQRADPVGYLDLLAGAGCEVDAWETTYVHVLSGEDPVLRWYRSTGLRPVLTALDAEARERFLAEYGQALRAAYPARPYGTPLRFRRVFAVARRR
ncbi:MAG: trans-aconitate 2-methyltransferase [Streptosporangiaceae bacterium]